MMRSPSKKRLIETFDLTPKQAALIKQLAALVGNGEALAKLIEENCPKTHAWARSCYSNPYDSQLWRRTMALGAIAEIIGAHGQGFEPGGGVDESNMRSGPSWEYANMGDTYATTLIYKREMDTLSIGCWGDIAERSL